MPGEMVDYIMHNVVRGYAGGTLCVLAICFRKGGTSLAASVVIFCWGIEVSQDGNG